MSKKLKDDMKDALVVHHFALSPNGVGILLQYLELIMQDYEDTDGVIEALIRELKTMLGET